MVGVHKLAFELDDHELERVHNAGNLAEALAPTRPHAASGPRQPTLLVTVRHNAGPCTGLATDKY
jgi:hypothetical protein